MKFRVMTSVICIYDDYGDLNSLLLYKRVVYLMHL